VVLIGIVCFDGRRRAEKSRIRATHQPHSPHSYLAGLRGMSGLVGGTDNVGDHRKPIRSYSMVLAVFFNRIQEK